MAVHNRYPIAPQEPLAGGAHGAPYVQTTVYACSRVGCAVRTRAFRRPGCGPLPCRFPVGRWRDGCDREGQGPGEGWRRGRPMDLIFAMRHPVAVHNRFPIAPQEPLAHGAHGAPYVQTTGYACSRVGCAVRTRVFRRPAAGLRLACCPWGGGGTGINVKVYVREKDGAVAGPWISSSQGAIRWQCTTVTPSPRTNPSHCRNPAHRAMCRQEEESSASYRAR